MENERHLDVKTERLKRNPGDIREDLRPFCQFGVHPNRWLAARIRFHQKALLGFRVGLVAPRPSSEERTDDPSGQVCLFAYLPRDRF